MEYPHEDLGGNNDFIRRSSQEDSQHNHNQQHQQYQDQSFDINININPLISNYQSQSPSPLNYHQGQFQSYNYNQIATPTASSSYQQPAPSPSGLPSYLSSRSSFDYSQQIDPSNYPNPYPIHSRTPSYSTDNSSSHSINNNINMPPANASNQVEKNHPCPNCGKAFAREDLLKRHMAREARAASQPVYERQKSCKECSRSKARCDLEVPSCGRCKLKNKECVYAPRSGNPNVRKARELEGAGVASGSAPPSRQSSGTFENPSVGPPSNQGGWAQPYTSSHDQAMKSEDDQPIYRDQRSYSGGSTSTLENGSHLMNPSDQRNQYQPQPQYYQPQAPEGYQTSYEPIQRSSSPYQHQLNSHILPPPSFRHGAGLPPTSNLDTYSSHLPPGVRMGNPSNPQQQHQQSNNRPDISMTIAPHLWPEGEAPSPSSLIPNSFLDSPNQRGGVGGGSKQMPPPLLTGARMPGPPSGVMRPSLFTASLDLSGWLDEPVVPSPLYRMGPSFNSLGSALGSAFPQFSARPIEGRNELPQTIEEEGGATVSTTTSSETPASSIQQPAQQQHQLQIIGPDGKPIESAPNMISARHWWSQSNKSAPEGAEALAQISAAHFKTYPALMVLPDPTSPVPPFLNRPWIAQLRALMPRSLAVARVVLAGYNVRLPPSEGMVWESIARETKALIAGLDRTLEASDTEVWAATASLWLYLILMMMSDDTSSTPYVDSTLVDNSLHTLSQLAKTLAERVSNHEEDYRPSEVVQDQNGNDGSSSAGGKREETFFSWGFGETMRRTLYATYVLLVLQRYRENALNVQSRLAGFELILDCQLPASANQFEAGNDQDWREARRKEAENLKKLKESDVNGDNKEGVKSSSTKDEDDQLNQDEQKPSITPVSPVNFVYPTMKDLIQARFRLDSSSKTLDAYFDQTDSFTNICLTIAFALDHELASADPNSLPSDASRT